MENLIECLECGNRYKRVSTTHLKKHNMSYDDYFTKYPGAKIEHPEVTEARKQTLDNMVKRYGESEGLKRWKLYCARQAETNTFEYKNFRYGMTKEEFDLFNTNRTKAMLAASGKSKISKEQGVPFILNVPKYKFNYLGPTIHNFGYSGHQYYKTRKRDKICVKGRCNYNPDSIPIIEAYGKEHGYNFQHAENGGEVRISRCYVDGYDGSNKVIFEYNERHHTRNVDRDKNRLDKIIKRIGPGWKIIIYWYNNKIEIIET
jgi:hypothetical protein